MFFFAQKLISCQNGQFLPKQTIHILKAIDLAVDLRYLGPSTTLRASCDPSDFLLHRGSALALLAETLS